MSDTIGLDGLTDDERRELEGDARFTGLLEALEKLGRERLTHAETRAERDRLRAALVTCEAHMTKVPPHGAGCVCGCPVIDGHTASCPVVRALLGEVKP